MGTNYKGPPPSFIYYIITKFFTFCLAVLGEYFKDISLHVTLYLGVLEEKVLVKERVDRRTPNDSRRTPRHGLWTSELKMYFDDFHFPIYDMTLVIYFCM